MGRARALVTSLNVFQIHLTKPRGHGKRKGAGHEFERVGCMLGCSWAGRGATRVDKEALGKSEGAGHEFERVLNLVD